MLTAPLLSLLLLAPPPAQAQELAQLEMRAVEIPLPGGGSSTAYRGMLHVPIVRAKPDSKPIGIDVWRFPASEGVPQSRPPLFQLNGGPGWPGIEPRDIDWDGDVAPLIAHGDLVIVGQRGIGTSEPDTSCERFAQPIDTSLPGAEQAAALRAQCSACRAHWEAEGYDLSGFNVLEAAADVNDVRRLLGYDEIALLGGSFGSHWAMAIMRYHPEAVARAVLHGMEGPDHTYDSPSGVLAALERIAKAAESAPALAEHLPEYGLIDSLRFVIQSLDEEPLDIEVDGASVRIDGDALRDLALGYTARVNSRRTVGGWPADVIRLYEGRFELAARAIMGNRASDQGLPTASFFGLDCGSGITRARLERYLNDPAIEVVGDLSRFYESACPAWEADLGDEFRTGFHTTIPTVVVHGTWDVSTPFDNALELVPCFENLHFVPVEGGTHGAFGEAIRHDEAFGEAVMAFLSTGATDGLPSSVELPPIEWRTSW